MVDIEQDFIRDCWYVAGWSEDFTHALTPLRILDEPVVIFRTEAGVPADYWPRQARAAFRPLQEGDLRILNAVMPVKPVIKALDGRQHARNRGIRQPLAATPGEKRANVRGMQVAKRLDTNVLTEVAVQEAEEACKVMAIGFNRIGREPALAFDIVQKGGEDFHLRKVSVRGLKTMLMPTLCKPPQRGRYTGCW